jgi:hypothetical protein
MSAVADGCSKDRKRMTLTEFIARCADDRRWLQSDELRNTPWVHLTGSAIEGAWRQIRDRLIALWQAALEVGGDPPVTIEDVGGATQTNTPKALGVLAAVAVVTRLQEWATARAAMTTSSQAQQLPANEACVQRANVPAELRELGRADGVVLTSSYLAATSGWDFSSTELTKAYHSGDLTYRLKVGRAYAYLYTELYRLREKRALRPAAR